MHNLIEFLAKSKHWFLFIVLEILSLILLFRFNDYQGSVWFTTANYISGTVYEVSSKISAFFSLGKINETLTQRNLLLERENKELYAKLYERTKDTAYLKRGQYRLLTKYQMVLAKVVDNSVNKIDNFITINKGTTDGVYQDMGVACGNGIVGIVYLAGNHYSVLIPVLNSKSNISCSILGRNYFGYLHWSGGKSDVAYLDDVPRHAKFKIGDRIVTSGYSSVFPAGILVGKIKHVYNSEDGLSYRLAIKLSTDFGNLRDVCVLTDTSFKEKQAIMQATIDSIKPLKEQNSTQKAN